MAKPKQKTIRMTSSFSGGVGQPNLNSGSIQTMDAYQADSFIDKGHAIEVDLKDLPQPAEKRSKRTRKPKETR